MTTPTDPTTLRTALERVAALEGALDGLLALQYEHGLNCYVTEDVGCLCSTTGAVEHALTVRLATPAPAADEARCERCGCRASQHYANADVPDQPFCHGCLGSVVGCSGYRPAPTPAPQPVAAPVDLRGTRCEAVVRGLPCHLGPDKHPGVVKNRPEYDHEYVPCHGAAARAEVDVEALVRFLTSHCGSRCTVDEHWRLFYEWQAALQALPADDR